MYFTSLYIFYWNGNLYCGPVDDTSRALLMTPVSELADGVLAGPLFAKNVSLLFILRVCYECLDCLPVGHPRAQDEAASCQCMYVCNTQIAGLASTPDSGPAIKRR